MAFWKKSYGRDFFLPENSWITFKGYSFSNAELFNLEKIQKEIYNLDNDFYFKSHLTEDFIHSYLFIYAEIGQSPFAPFEKCERAYKFINKRFTNSDKKDFQETVGRYVDEGYIYYNLLELDNCCSKKLPDLIRKEWDRQINYNYIYKNIKYDFADVRELSNLEEEAINNFINKLLTYLDENNIKNRLIKLAETAYDLSQKMINDYFAEEKKEEEIKKEKRQQQEYIDWIKNGNPVYCIHGLSIRGAKYVKLTIDEAFKQLEKEKPFEYDYLTINNQKSLVLQYVFDSDLW